MHEIIEVKNDVDVDGNPAGGLVSGMGLAIQWQKGALGVFRSRQEPNGAFVETVLEAVRQRLDFYQTAANGKFACRENAMALTKIDEALLWLGRRTKDRRERGVEGTLAV